MSATNPTAVRPWSGGEPMFGDSLVVPLEALRAKGYCFLPNFITAPACLALSQAVEMRHFTPARELLGGVVQQFDDSRLDLLERPTAETLAFEGLAVRLGKAVNTAAATVEMSSLTRWSARELTIQRYESGAVGIGPHRDFERDRLLVAVVNLSGHATFNIFEEDRMTSRDHWLCEPGDLILLAGTGAGSRYDRPVHSVTNVRGPRVSLTYRMPT